MLQWDLENKDLDLRSIKKLLIKNYFLIIFLDLNKMSHVTGDYSNSAGASSCSFATLSGYSGGYSMNVPPQGKVTSGAYIVPSWSPISYDSLTAKVPNCSGYYGIESAYGSNAAQCQTTYRTSLCGNR